MIICTAGLTIVTVLYSISTVSGLREYSGGSQLWEYNDPTYPERTFPITYDVDHGATNNLRMFSIKKDVEQRVKFYFFSRVSPKPIPLIPGVSNAFVKKRLHLPTKIIIHGYLENSNSATTSRMRKRFLEAMDVNTIQVDWGKGSILPIYWPAQKNVEHVGRYLARLVDWLMAEGADRSNIHIIGHSLGAHVAGFAGAFATRGKVARITGLDPALPGYVNVGPELRLDPTDADYVDVIHTCDGLYGFPDRAGHADFYVNGGRNRQPGCSHVDLGICSHIRSADYFTESIDPKHKFEAALCNDVPRTGPKSCKWSTYLMGYHLDKGARGMFYVQTNKKYPFAMKVEKR